MHQGTRQPPPKIQPKRGPQAPSPQGNDFSGGPPGWLGLRELELAGSAALRLGLIMQEASLWGRHVYILCARRSRLGPKGAVRARAWAALSPQGVRSLRRPLWLAGGSALALASHHLCPWRGPPTAADEALLTALFPAHRRPPPREMAVLPAALGERHTLLVAIDDGDAPLPRQDLAPLAAQVYGCAASWQRQAQAPRPVGWPEVSAAAELVAGWALAR